MRALQLIGRWEGGARGFGERGREGAHGLRGRAADVVGDYRKRGDLEVEGGKAGEVLDGDHEAAELGLDGDEAVGAHGCLLIAPEGLGEGVDAVDHLVVVGVVGAEEAEDAVRREDA